MVKIDLLKPFTATPLFIYIVILNSQSSLKSIIIIPAQLNTWGDAKSVLVSPHNNNNNNNNYNNNNSNNNNDK